MAATRTTARNTLAALPRSLRIAPSTPITRTHLLALYKEHLRISHSFGSYNFKQYFIRRTRNKFRSELPNLLDQAYVSSPTTTSKLASSSSSTSQKTESSEENSIYAPTKTESSPTATRSPTTESSSESRLREWYADSLSELAVMARAAIVNRMYEAPKLVVEGRAKMMVSGGGGAGVEASYGGAGQPADGQKDVPATPASSSQSSSS